VGTGTDTEIVLRRRDVEFLEEHVREDLVVVLSGVDEQFVVVPAERP
jgi:hypothetical protein